MFWPSAAALLLLAGALVAWPLIGGGKSSRLYGLALALAIAAGALFLYPHAGTPEGIRVSGVPGATSAVDHQQADAQLDDLLGNLEQRLLENPGDLEGWLLLGRSYKATQQYPQAERALSRASQLAPDDPLVIAELAEARIYASGETTIGAETRAMLERALLLDPGQQKALWLLGIAAMQAGSDALAVEYWQRLLSLVDADSDIAASVQRQINAAQGRTGAAPASAWAGLEVAVTLAGEAPALPPSAVLFVIARDPAAPNPPVGVMKIANPVFPLSARLDDSHSMLQQRPISGVEDLQVQARLSMSGNAIAQPGDLHSEAATVSPEFSDQVELTITR